MIEAQLRKNEDCLRRSYIELCSAELELVFKRYSLQEVRQVIIYLCFSNTFSMLSYSVLLDKSGTDGLGGWTAQWGETGVTTWLKEWQFKDINKDTVA